MALKSRERWHLAKALGMSASQIHLNLQTAFVLLSLPDEAAEKACHLIYILNLPGGVYQGVLLALS